MITYYVLMATTESYIHVDIHTAGKCVVSQISWIAAGEDCGKAICHVLAVPYLCSCRCQSIT